jgi:hypothetical protein
MNLIISTILTVGLGLFFLIRVEVKGECVFGLDWFLISFFTATGMLYYVDFIMGAMKK